MTHQPETAELIQAAAKLDPSAWLSAEGTPVRLHPDAAAALGGLLVAIAHTDDETLNKASLVRSAALTAARVVAASSLDAACAHCGSNDHTWDDCEAYTRLTADAYARTLNTPPSAETCAAIRDRLHSGSEPAAVSAAVAPPTQAALRDRIADTLATADGWVFAPGFKEGSPTYQGFLRQADAVLAVLPEVADRAAVYCEAADRMSKKASVLTEDLHDLAHFVAKDRLREAEILDREAAELRRMADETATETPQPRRGDAFEQWLKAQRNRYDRHGESSEFWHEFDRALDQYRLHADTGTPLGEHVCEGKTVGDCECLEQPAAGARQDGAET